MLSRQPPDRQRRAEIPDCLTLRPPPTGGHVIALTSRRVISYSSVMSPITLPNGTLMSPPQPFTTALLERTLTDMGDAASNFTGFISVATADRLLLLFFFRSRPYAAGCSVGEKPTPLSIADFLGQTSRMVDATATLSTHACDPVLLKCLLIFIQDEPTAKAPTDLINLESVLAQIRQEAADALIILEKGQMFNFFFFKDGVRGMSYFADTGFTEAEGLDIDEQLLLYAFQPGAAVDALVYRSIATREAPDAEMISREEMLALLQGKNAGVAKEVTEVEEIVEANVIEENLVLSVVDGPLKGQILSGPIPCIIGRKDADIILNDPMVSKSHAAIQLVNGKLLLMDLNSTNGTIVNGRPVRQHDITGGDVIAMGSTVLKVLRIQAP